MLGGWGIPDLISCELDRIKMSNQHIVHSLTLDLNDQFCENKKIKESKGAKVTDQYNQGPHLTLCILMDTNGLIQ